MKNKIMMFVLLGMIILSLGSVSALKIDYTANDQAVEDMKVIFSDTILFGLIKIGEQGTIELKSHKTPTEIIKVGAGNQVTMFYDFNFKDIYENGLGDVKFINMKNGAEVQRDWKFVYWFEETREKDVYECKDLLSKNGTITSDCFVSGKESYLFGEWKDYNSKTIPKEKIRIGIMVDSRNGDYIDGIWEIQNKEITRHASWSASLDTNLIHYWEMNETSGNIIDYAGSLTGTNNGATLSTDGALFKRSESDFIALGNEVSYNAFSISVLAKPIYTGISDLHTIIAKDVATSRQWVMGYDFTSNSTTNTIVITQFQASGKTNYGEWTHIVFTFDESSNVIQTFINGTKYTSTNTANAVDDSTALFIGKREYVGADAYYNGYLKGLAYWNRVLTDDEVAELYGDGQFYSYQNVTSAISVILNYPDNASTLYNKNILFNGTISDTSPINVSFILDGQYNETNISGILGDYLFNKTLGEGLHNWNIETCIIDSCINATERTLTIDTTPFIEFLTPPTLENYANITQEYIPMKVNVSTLYYENNSFFIQNVNGTFFEQFFTNETYDINFTNLPDAHYHYNATICTTTGKCNSTETRHLNHDTSPPTLELFSPLTNYTTLTLPINVTLNFTAQDDALDSCWYGYNGTNTTFTCNTAPNISISQEGWNEIDYYANDTFGNEASGTAPFYIYYVQRSATATNPITEGGVSSHSFYLNMSDITNFNATAELYWNGTSKGLGTKTILSNNALRFDKTLIVPSINGTSVDWNWVYNISGNPNVTDYNLSGSQTYVKINISECGAGTYQILNYTLYDQDTRALGTTDNASIEVDLTLTSQANESLSWQYHATKSSSTSFLICLPSGALNNSAYYLDSISKYSYQAHVVQYHYVENFNLTNESIPQIIKLYDLATDKSTSFLINYQDENYIYVENAVIDVWRRYIGEGVFFSVEHGKTDASGQTRLHLVTEDIIYKFLVWQDGELVYTSPEYLALCQATPCQINLKKSVEDTSSFSERDNIIYDYDFDEDTRTASFTFATKDNTETTFNMTILSSNQYENDTACSTSLTTSGGQIDCIIPVEFTNTSYQTLIYQNGEYFGTAFESLAPNSMEIFGYTGLILTAISFLMLALMGISSGIATIIFGIVGLVFMGLIQIFESGSVFGLGSAILWLIVAGTIIIIKITKRRIQ